MTTHTSFLDVSGPVLPGPANVTCRIMDCTPYLYFYNGLVYLVGLFLCQGPVRVTYNDSIGVMVTGAVLVAPGSVTHNFNTNQRVVGLQVCQMCVHLCVHILGAAVPVGKCVWSGCRWVCRWSPQQYGHDAETSHYVGR